MGAGKADGPSIHSTWPEGLVKERTWPDEGFFPYPGGFWHDIWPPPGRVSKRRGRRASEAKAIVRDANDFGTIPYG
jgi:hypothetical protein